MAKTAGARAKKKEIAKALMLSPLFHELNPQQKKTIIAELTERTKESEHEVKRSRILKAGDGDKRAHHRKKVLTIVDYAIPDKFFRDYVHNISEGGTFIRTGKPLAVGTDITLTLVMPESGIPIKIKGEVIWIGKKGMGLKFKEVDQLTKGKIRSILSEM